MHPAPDTPHRLAHALHYPPLLERLDLGPRRVQYQLHLSLYPIHLEPLQRYHLVAAVHWGRVSRARDRDKRQTIEAARDGFVAVSLLDDKLDVWVVAGDALDVMFDESACVGRRGAVLAELEDDFADGRDECGVPVGGCSAQLGPPECGGHRGGKDGTVGMGMAGS